MAYDFWQAVRDMATAGGSTAPVVSGVGGGTTVLYPVPEPPTGVIVVTGQEPALPAGPIAGSGCCDRCSLRGKAGPGGPGGNGGVVAIVPAGTTAGPLGKAAPLPWWVYVLVGFAVGRLFRG